MSRAADSPLPLADAVSSAVGFDWSHGVAIVLQLLDQLAHDGRVPSGAFPHIERIALSPSGFLLTELEPQGTDPLAGLGRLLHWILGPTNPPAALRVLVAQASAVRPAMAFHDLVRELKKWDSPVRLAILSDLHGRASGRVSLVAQSPTAVPDPPVAGLARSGRRSGRRLRLGRLVVLTTGAAAAGLLLSAILVYGPTLPEIESVSLVDMIRSIPLVDMEAAIASQDSPEPGPDAVGAESAPAAARGGPRSESPQRTGPPGGRVEQAAPRARVPPPAASSPEIAGYSPEVMREAEEQFRQARLLFERQDYKAAAAAFSEVVDVLERGDPALELRLIAAELADASRVMSSSAAAEADARVQADAGADAEADPTRVYTSTDAGVTEPVTSAHLPPAAGPGTPPDRIGVLDLLIDTHGRVESARVVHGEQRFRDRWLISTAKAWRFKPATRDGQPVRFLKRHTFVLDRQPGIH